MRHYTRAEMEQVFNSIVGERLPGQGVQSIVEASTVQRYEIGSRLAIKDRVYHYAHVQAGGTGLTAGWGTVNKVTLLERAADSVVVGGFVGARQITLEAQGDVRANQFRNGFIFYTADVGPADSVMVPVLTNTAAAAGDNFVVTLEHGLPRVLTAGQGCTIVANIWTDVDMPAAIPAGSAGFQTIVGVPLITVAAGSFAWLQTWGMCIVVGAEATGDTIDLRRLRFDNAGSMALCDTLAGENNQRAGTLATLSRYAIPPAAAAGHSGNTFILELYP